MKRNWKTYLTAAAIPLAVGGLSSLLTNSAMKHFAEVNQPPLSPPAWVFPVAWSALYVLMGIASGLVWLERDRADVKQALRFYAAQLVFNFFWSIFFFNFGLYLFSAFWLLALWILSAVTMGLFARVRRSAGLLLIPYLLWLAFAEYLNLGVWWLNR